MKKVQMSTPDWRRLWNVSFSNSAQLLYTVGWVKSDEKKLLFKISTNM